jgi:hypothetical protein
VRLGGLAMRLGGLVLWPIVARFVVRGLGVDYFCFFIISRSDSLVGFPYTCFLFIFKHNMWRQNTYPKIIIERMI